MTDLAPSQTALRLCAALALAAAVLSLFIASIPMELLGMRPPFYQPQGLGYLLYMGASLAVSLLLLLVGALLPQAALSPEPSRTARTVALLATLAIALIALANMGLASLPQGELSPTRAYWTQVIVQSLGALLTILPALVLAGALALRLPPSPGRTLGLIALALLVPLDLAASAGLSGLPTAGLLLLLVLVLAVALHRAGRLPAQARPWLIGLATLWALPWAIGHLPPAGAALMLSDPSQRAATLMEALLGDPPAYHLGSLTLLLTCLGALAALLFTQAPRQAQAIATLLAVIGLCAALAPALGIGHLSATQSWEMFRSGAFTLGQATASSLTWAGALLAPIAAAVAAAWLWLIGARVPL